MKNRSCSFSLLLLLFFARQGVSQTLPVGAPLLDEFLRRWQLEGQVDSNVSFTIRPLFTGANVSPNLLFGIRNGATDSAASLTGKKPRLRVLPLTLSQQLNSHHPYGWNDGSLIPAKGYQFRVSAGVFSRFGPVTVQLQPELVVAQNASYAGFPDRYGDSLWKSYYNTVLNLIDAPERFGSKTYVKLFPGQSSVRLNFNKFSFGVSTENLWWGPGLRNALLMSNNAPGFPHLSLNTTSPLRTPVGTFEGQLISGLLKKSGYPAPDTGRHFNGTQLYIPKPTGNRYLNGMVVTWQPKWTKGLFLGFSRAFYIYTADLKHSINGYLPVIGQLFKGSAPEVEDAQKRDQLLSLFFRIVLPKESAEVYGEFGRNDHSGNRRDLALEPEHSGAYVIGLRKLFATGKKNTRLELFAEQANLQIPLTGLLREQGSWYAHYQVRDGYTNHGQVIGAGIGPGGNSQTLGLALVGNRNKTGLLLERVTHNNDFYYAAFTPSRTFWRHWVDLSAQLNKSWQHGNFLYDGRIGLVKSLNYQWQDRVDVYNLNLVFAVSYLF